MSKQKLIMKYHPAKKEVEFRRFQSGKEVPIRNDSKLRTYMNQKGKFVLQNYGNALFDDIAKAFDGEREVNIEVITTQLDFEDFKQMAEYYNEGGKCQMNLTLKAKLPDMDQTFLAVKKHGEESISILESHKQKLFEIPLENENVKKSAESFAGEISTEIKNIKEKIDSLNDNSINLCFTGVYSSGKSTLINALLGYKIVPERITSETAKMLKISSPKPGEKVKIKFEILTKYSELEWDENEQQFWFKKGPAESDIRTDIQKTLNKVKDEKYKQHEQINRILTELNKNPDVSSTIQILFPVALDSEKVQFTIFDTPGSDSNYLEHKQVLTEALKEQTQSILIFVAKPDGLEGSGNNALLNYLKEAEQKSSKTSIDMGRSLFVINKADTVLDGDREALQKQEIKHEDDDSFSIQLADKKLFFISAKYAYVAKAVRNGIATCNDIAMNRNGNMLMTTEPMGNCYQQNHCATSELATKQLIKRCEDALSYASKIENNPEILVICSGLYALESEILQYGEKFASAVKAFAIIDSVDKTLAKLKNQANSLHDSNQQDIAEIEKSIRELEFTVQKAINKEYANMRIPSGEPFPSKVVEYLQLDGKTLKSSIIGSTKTYIEKELKGWFMGLGKVKVKDEHKDKVRKYIDNAIHKFRQQFLLKRKELLEKQRDTFIEGIKETINQNGNISESAKKFVLDIPAPSVSESGIKDLEGIYNSHKRIEKVLIFKSEYLDKKGFIDDIEVNLAKIIREMIDDYSKDYRESLDTVLTQIKSEFEKNLDKYSLYMKSMGESKEAMKSLGEKISDAAKALEECQSKLNEIIWREI